MNHIKLISLFMLKLCNPNGLKNYLQSKYRNLKFRPKYFFAVHLIFRGIFFIIFIQNKYNKYLQKLIKMTNTYNKMTKWKRKT